MNKNKYHCNIFLFTGWLIMLVGCQHAPSSLLKKAMQMENVSVDSIFFYLQQIDKPENLSSKQQGDYYFLSYKATLWKTGKPADSLLQTAIHRYTQIVNCQPNDIAVMSFRTIFSFAANLMRP